MTRKLMPIICIAAVLAMLFTGCEPTITDLPALSSDPSSSEFSSETTVMQPQNIGNMTLGSVIYAAKQSVTVYVVDISELEDGMKAALRCLQGLVSREDAAAIYLVDDDEDEFWRRYCASEYGVFFKDSTADELFLRYNDLIKKIIIYDDGEGYEFNTAFTKASVENGICIDKGAIMSLDADIFKGKPTEDVRGIWQAESDAQNYGFEQLMPYCNQNYIATASSESEFLDYLYAAKAFCVNIDANSSSVIQRAAETAASETFGLYFGAESDENIITLLSKSGYVFVPSDELANSTMLSSLPRLNTQMVQSAETTETQGTDKIYLSVNVSPGEDALENVQGYLKDLQSQEIHLKKLGYMVNPILYELAHPVMSWYYQNKSAAHEIISATDGIGRVDWSAFKSEYLQQLRDTNEYLMHKCGMNVMPLSSSAGACSEFIQGSQIKFYFTAAQDGQNAAGVPVSCGDAVAAGTYYVHTEEGFRNKIDTLEDLRDKSSVYLPVIFDESNTGDEFTLSALLKCIDGINSESGGDILLIKPSDMSSAAETNLKSQRTSESAS